MRPLDGTPTAGTVEAGTKVADFARDVEASGQPFAVLEEGRAIGQIGRPEVMAVLLEGRS